MAYIRDYTSKTALTATGLTPTMPTHEANDLLLFCIGKKGSAGTFSTPSGYTQLRNDAYSNTIHTVFYKIASSSSETAPTSSTSDSNQYCCYMLSIADVDTTTPIHSSRVDTATANINTSTAITTTNNNTLNLWAFISNNAQHPVPQRNKISLNPNNGSALDNLMAWNFQRTAGSTGTHSIYKYSPTDGQVVTMCINSSGTPIVPAQIDSSTETSDMIHPMYFSGNSYYVGGVADPTSDVTTLDGKTTFYGAIVSDQPGSPFYFNLIGLSRNNTTTVDLYCLGLRTINAKDLSGKKMIMHLTSAGPAYTKRFGLVSDNPVCVGLRSGSSPYAYRFWTVAGFNSLPNIASNIPVIIDIDDTSNMLQETGTFDSTNVTGVLIGHVNSYGQEMRLNASSCQVLNTLVQVDGSSGSPGTFKIFGEMTRGVDMMSIIDQNRSSQTQLFCFQNLQIGNGSTSTYFQDSGVSLEFPTVFNQPARKIQYNVAENEVGLTLYGVSGDIIRINDTTISGGSEWNFTIHASSTSSATWDFTGLIIVNALVTLQDVFTALDGVVFRNCQEVVTNSADLSGGCTFDNTKGSQAVTITGSTQAGLQAELDNLANCNFINNSTVGIRVEYTGTGDITLNFTAMTFTDNTVDIHYNSTNASALTANMASGSNATTTSYSGSATGVTISNDVTVTFANLQAGSQLTVLESGTQNEDLHVESTGTSENWSFTAPLGHSFDYQILKGGYKAIWSSNNTAVTVDTTINISQEIDQSYG